MITVDFSKNKDIGLCEQLYNTIKTQIMNTTLKPDSKLPSKRALASHLGISVITVQNAYAQLISEGYIYSIEKKGFYVTDFSDFNIKPHNYNSAQGVKPQATQPAQSTQAPEFFTDFRSNSTNAQKFPFTLWSHTARQVLNSQDEKLLIRSDMKGTYELRLAIAEYLLEFRNMQVSPQQIVIGAGTEALYSMLVQYFGRDKVYAVENPGYKKAKAIFELNGALCTPIDIDSQGMNPESLRKKDVEIIHISPNHHFPTGIVVPVKRRMELLAWANEQSNRYIIEDDYDSEFRFNGKPLPTLQSADTQNKVFYMNTFSKTLAPSFRISYLVLPASLTADFEKKLGSYSCQVSVIEQSTLAHFISAGFFEKHINKMKNYYRTLRNNLISELQKSPVMPLCKITEQEAGLHFLLTITTDKTPQQIKDNMKKNGINVSLLSDYYYSTYSSRECTLVINYSALKKERIAETVEKMCKSILL
ncbi:MAG: PLP-dependent aminotransferase family protein [Treponema sp.]|nr:PLP-dependent aminotransferase family protein [Treponema sp.]